MRNPKVLARLYFTAGALGGAAWWASIPAFPVVQEATLGSLPVNLMALLDIPLFVIASALIASGLTRLVWVAVPWTLLITGFMIGYTLITGEAVWGTLIMVVASCGSVVALCLVRYGSIPIQHLLVGPFRFRAARNTRTGGHLFRTAAQMLVFWGLFLGVIPLLLLWGERYTGIHLTFPEPLTWAGAAIFIGASALGIWSAIAMAVRGRGTPLPADMATRLVITGPYRWVRNPMAVAGIMQGVGVGMMLSSWLTVVYALSGSLIWNWLIRPSEEADLAERFGTEYIRYQELVPCWLPKQPSPALSAGVQ